MIAILSFSKNLKGPIYFTWCPKFYSSHFQSYPLLVFPFSNYIILGSTRPQAFYPNRPSSWRSFFLSDKKLQPLPIRYKKEAVFFYVILFSDLYSWAIELFIYY